jgi:hypothetical protein
LQLKNNYNNSHLVDAPGTEVVVSQAAFASFLLSFAVFASTEVDVLPTVVVHLHVYSFLHDVKEIRPNAAAAKTNFFMFCFV